MEQAINHRTPLHLWLVGALSLLWNSIGGIDYTLTRLRNMDYLTLVGDPAAILAYVDAMPMYAQIGWGLGVWGALAGSVLLLMRSRYAVHAFAVSLAGALISLGGQIFGPPIPGATEASKYMPLVIIALAAVQLWYALRVRKAGVLN
ncbi:MAG: hypothetical protein ABIS38_04360 [Sphingomicrobium sp.]